MRILALQPRLAASPWPDEHLTLFPERRAGTLFPLGLALAAEILARAHEVETLDENVTGSVASPLAWDMIAVHATLASLPRILELSDATRGTPVRLLAGGPLATACPELLADRCDLLLLGEAEPLAERLLATVETPARGVRIGPGPRATDLHAPDPSRFPQGAELVPYELARGCDHGCRFCGTPVSFPGGRIAKPRERVAGEVAALAGGGSARALFVVDDDAAADPELFARLLAELSRHGMRAVAKARADSLAALPGGLDLSPLAYLNVVLRERPEDPPPGPAERALIAGFARRRVRVEATLLFGHPADDESLLATFETFLRGLPLTKICLLPVMPLPREGDPRATNLAVPVPRARALEHAFAACGLAPERWLAFVARARETMAREGFAALKAALSAAGGPGGEESR